jgi:hypothetical protein
MSALDGACPKQKWRDARVDVEVLDVVHAHHPVAARGHDPVPVRAVLRRGHTRIDADWYRCLAPPWTTTVASQIKRPHLHCPVRARARDIWLERGELRRKHFSNVSVRGPMFRVPRASAHAERPGTLEETHGPGRARCHKLRRIVIELHRVHRHIRSPFVHERTRRRIPQIRRPSLVYGRDQRPAWADLHRGRVSTESRRDGPFDPTRSRRPHPHPTPIRRHDVQLARREEPVPCHRIAARVDRGVHAGRHDPPVLVVDVDGHCARPARAVPRPGTPVSLRRFVASTRHIVEPRVAYRSLIFVLARVGIEPELEVGVAVPPVLSGAPPVPHAGVEVENHGDAVADCHGSVVVWVRHFNFIVLGT